ncbi:cytokine receptor-like factor 2 [Hemicordylus capensis]|uniref:cytokine receptor-like factor 2 n=1 Tax=Hemicordylus capensis TaxID=884348 RepID=UPI0023027914|nr:cytokine receptor-like factor 2 [Hemicordylus capensis]
MTIFRSVVMDIQAYAAVFLWSNLLASLSWAQYLEDKNGSQIKYTIINLNNKHMEVSWEARKNFPDMNVTMRYKFDKSGFEQCPQYILDRGYNTGCFFETRGEVLHVSIRDTTGGKELYFDEQTSLDFFKPNPPENVTFQWKDNKVTTRWCNPLKFYSSHCLNFGLQYKSTFDNEWQSRNKACWDNRDQEKSCCLIRDRGFDPVKCYSFRFRLNADECNLVPYSSEWGEETFWENGTRMDSCAKDVSELESNIVSILASVLAAFLVIFVILVGVCRLERIRKTIMPDIPDPKHIYSDLFSDHNGNFQAWISKTENVLAETKVEYMEEECIVQDEQVEGIWGPKVEDRVL